jgi:hypothetical protein
MPIIEIQDLRAPWTSKTNIISMVLAIALFAAFRILGGGLGLNLATRNQIIKDSNIEDKSQASSSLGQWENDDDQLILDRRSEMEQSASKDSSGFVVQDDGFDPLAGTGEDSGSEQEEDGGFVEIERELGLR